MTNVFIHNPGQAFALGGTWQTAPVDVTMSTDQVDMINATGIQLYTGDVVALDSTGGEVILNATGALTQVFGCVGAAADLNSVPANYYEAGTLETGISPLELLSVWPVTVSGNYQPNQDYAWSAPLVGFTNASQNITSASTAATNPLTVGAQIITPYNSSTNATPQIFEVVSNGGSSGSWTAVTVTIAGTAGGFTGTTGSFTVALGNMPGALGPGWGATAGWTNASAFGPGQIVPIIVRGFGRVNINALSSIAASDGVGGTNASVVGTRFAYASTGYASACGLIIAVCLEAYAARDTTLRTQLGITGHDSVRAIIGKM